MSDALAAEGVQLVNAGKYTEGIEKLTKALTARPAPLWLIERSKAYLRTGDFELSLHDTEVALSVAFKRANRDLMTEAQLRRAITLFRMGRFSEADIVAYWAMKLVQGAKASEDDGQDKLVDANGDYQQSLKVVMDASAAENEARRAQGMGAAMNARSKDEKILNQAFSWRVQALTQMEQLPAGAPGRKVNVVKYPTPSETAPTKQKYVEEEEEEKEEGTPKAKIPDDIRRQIVGEDPPDKVWEKIWSTFRTAHDKNNVRTDFYQSETVLNVSLFVKNVSKDDLKVDAQEQSITLSPIPSIPSGTINLQLFDKIKPNETTYNIKSMKIELALCKETPGKWPSIGDQSSIPTVNASAFRKHAETLGYDKPEDLTLEKFGSDTQAWYSALTEKLQTKAGKTDTPVTASPETYKAPTATTSEVNKTSVPAKAKAEAAPSYPTSSKKGPQNWDKLEDEDEDEKSKDVNDFFKQIYASGDDNMKRAMMKSFVESNGTALSTSWADAGSKKYDTQPPDGAEAKNWD